MSEPIEIKLDNKEVESRLLDLAKRSENLRPLMKNIAGIFAYSTEENFKEEGRPDKWTELSESTIKQRTKNKQQFINSAVKPAKTNLSKSLQDLIYNLPLMTLKKS